jgi:hypothetical protein
MRFCQLIVEKDAAFACVSELGKQPWVQFKDVSFLGLIKRLLSSDVLFLHLMECWVQKIGICGNLVINLGFLGNLVANFAILSNEN